MLFVCLAQKWAVLSKKLVMGPSSPLLSNFFVQLCLVICYSCIGQNHKCPKLKGTSCFYCVAWKILLVGCYCIYTFSFQNFLFFLLQASKIHCSFAALSLLCSEWRVSAKDMISLMCHLAMLCRVGMVICSFHLLDSVEGEPWFPSQDSHSKSGCCSALQVDT